MDKNYERKYIKYKSKYLTLRRNHQYGGGSNDIIINNIKVSEHSPNSYMMSSSFVNTGYVIKSNVPMKWIDIIKEILKYKTEYDYVTILRVIVEYNGNKKEINNLNEIAPTKIDFIGIRIKK